MKKICSKCLIDKDVCEFHKHNREKDGRFHQCKECRSDKFKDDYQNLPEFSKTHKKRTKEYALNNRKKINEYFKLRYVNKPHEYAW
jgi:hypothetical protein